MAKERLTLYDKYGNVVDYDVSTEDVTLDNEGGKSLKQKLAEVDEGIGEQVKKVVFNRTTKNASNGIIDLGDQMQPDWNESSQSYPSYIRNKPNVVTGIRIGSSGSTMVPTDGVITLPESGGTVECDPAMSSTSENPVQNKVIKAYVDAVSQRIDTLIGSGNVQGAIDTFNEVVAFLDGINSSDTLAAKLALKANDNEVVKSISVNGQTPQTPTNGNVNVVVPTLTLDNEPTEGSPNPVKSGGIKTALDAKANVADVPTNQDMADAIDDALGEAQVTVVPASSVGVISSLGSGSTTDALSASMGKKLKVVILSILNSLGNYAFPNGKPVIDWGDDTPVTYTVSKTIGTGLSATGGDADVALGDSLEVTIAITNNLYVVDDNSVVVAMGGSPVVGAWNASTQKVTIAAVTGDVVINIPSMTYVSSNLAFHLDCKNRGGQSGHWIDLIGNKDFTLNQVQESDSGMVFDGINSTALHSGSLAVGHKTGTIEFVIEPTNGITARSTILFNGYEEGIIAVANDDSSTQGTFKGISTAYSGTTANDKLSVELTGLPAAASLNINNNGNRAALVDGVVGNSNIANLYFGVRAVRTGKMTVGCFINDTTGAALPVEAITIKAIRVYSSQLTLAQAQLNYKIDKKRFNLS